MRNNELNIRFDGYLPKCIFSKLKKHHFFSKTAWLLVKTAWLLVKTAWLLVKTTWLLVKTAWFLVKTAWLLVKICTFDKYALYVKKRTRHFTKLYFR